MSHVTTPPPGFTARTIPVAGVPTLLWERRGDGPTLVFLPGGALDTVELTWSEVIVRLPPDWGLVIPDLPGYGGSGPPGRPTTAWYAAWLSALLDARAPERPFVAASSAGAAAALALACAQPERMAGLVLSGAYGLQAKVLLHPLAARLVRLPGLAALARTLLRPRPVLRLLFRLAVLDPQKLTDDLVEDAHAGLTPPHALDAFMAWLRDELRPEGCTTDLRACLPGLDVPLLFVHGTFDPFIPAHVARRAADLAPNASLLQLPAAHLPPREHPDAVAEALVRLVRSETVW
jgi:pimeloyl-ACP methyl ester carboxylesterase